MNKKSSVISHLNLSDRMRIESGLARGETFKSIASEIGKDPSTVSKEVRRFLDWHDGRVAAEPGNNCRHYSTCTFDLMCIEDCSGYCKDCYRHACNHLCNRFEPLDCQHLKCAPYVCNGCSLQSDCILTKYFYVAEEAQERYEKLLVDSRSGINMELILSILVDTFISKISLPMQPAPEIGSISGA